MPCAPYGRDGADHGTRHGNPQGPRHGDPGEPEKVLHTLDPEPGGDGRCHAVLEPLPVLAEGRWDLYLLSGPGAQRQRLRPGPRDVRALVDGHLRERTSPVAVRVPYATKDGYLAVRAWLRTAHAEVHGLHVTDGSTTVRARLHGASLADGAVVRLRLRGGKGTALSAGARADGDGRGFSFTVDHGQLTAGIWDLSVQPAADAPLIRIGRLLDDVADRKAVFVHPSARAVDGALQALVEPLGASCSRPLRASAEPWWTSARASS
ncbi:hypothetical protein [Streptomyces sp. TRM68367]|uniref:hypothetical protein n=1 Tax=Streptomyces sp. TRM68367 TaxID=2758415 RepID=UPI00165C9296|nr:hypothetical protein [Streptomyces sp. TRM68367]MBC9728207.1 hypothetical protein [Streptomyces sp. TRM68367]